MPETVTIHSERRAAVPLLDGTAQDMIIVTYSTATIAPRQVYIDPTHDTQAERVAKIKADIEAYRKNPPATLQLT